jgi:RNA polymerase sigma-70 factor (ECF subfamily)
MANQSDQAASRRDNGHWFTTTHWSVVLAAGHGSGEERARALERLCQTYWRPLYLYVRRRGHGPDDAQDLTQEFFRAFLQKNAVERADRTRGRFRTFLLCSLQNLLAKEWRKANTAKRGGRQPMLPLDAAAAETQYLTNRFEELTPEKAYEKSWAVATLEEAMVNLHSEYQRSGKGGLFEQLRLLLWDEPKGDTYAELGQQLAMSEAAVKMAASRLRQRARELLRRQIANTVATPDEIEEEFRYLVAVLRV